MGQKSMLTHTSGIHSAQFRFSDNSVGRMAWFHQQEIAKMKEREWEAILLTGKRDTPTKHNIWSLLGN